MISYIKGEVTEMFDDTIVVESGNIGYNIKVPSSLMARVQIGSTYKIYTYLSVREDAMNLFGFSSRDELNIFKMVIGVNGIGPKAGLAILSALSADELRLAVLADDKKTISKCPGIGPKTASKLILELKDKLKLSDVIENGFMSDDTIENVSDKIDSSARNEAIEALVALGYTNTDALKAIRMVEITEDMDSSAILKAALKKLTLI